METIDALGDKCPLPVIKAKKALDAMDEGSICVHVDNKEAVNNLGKLAKSRNMDSTSQTLDDDTFNVVIVKSASDATCEADQGNQSTQGAQNNAAGGPTIVCIGSDKMGAGDDELGDILMKAFIFAITQLDTLPEKVIMFNAGVKLACQGAETLDDLNSLAANGVEILACGTCLNHFNLADSLAVGEVTNMYAIVEAQAMAGRIIRP